MVDFMCGYRWVVISGRVIPDEVAKSVYSKLTSEHIRSVIYRILHYPGQIKRMDCFITASLYNSMFTENLDLFSGFTADTGLEII